MISSKGLVVTTGEVVLGGLVGGFVVFASGERERDGGARWG